jgi:hypothetical protein
LVAAFTASRAFATAASFTVQVSPSGIQQVNYNVASHVIVSVVPPAGSTASFVVSVPDGAQMQYFTDGINCLQPSNGLAKAH